jgi:hypothetical protein
VRGELFTRDVVLRNRIHAVRVSQRRRARVSGVNSASLPARVENRSWRVHRVAGASIVFDEEKQVTPFDAPGCPVANAAPADRTEAAMARGIMMRFISLLLS